MQAPHQKRGRLTTRINEKQKSKRSDSTDRRSTRQSATSERDRLTTQINEKAKSKRSYSTEGQLATPKETAWKNGRGEDGKEKKREEEILAEPRSWHYHPSVRVGRGSISVPTKRKEDPAEPECVFLAFYGVW
ncbi:hypothetical protein CDAR_586591 [Caerostris darwini]|uniref:Uncharacterized protein n=1 Tax=Caerostris darwini TaxID=1538125 RepID=A0AAV4QAC2_9ARAC|nr:hypothetical protein CDAR_586591 [Caerostris darwini]